MDTTTATTPNTDARGEQQLTPERIFQTLNAYQASAGLKAAIELDIFTAVAEGNDTAAKIAERCGAAERGVRILCDFLTVEGFLSKEGGGYRPAPDAALFLDRRSPAYMGGVIGFLSRPFMHEAFGNLAECVRRGGTALEGEGSVTPENPIWDDFARSMAGLVRPSAEAIAQVVGAAGAGPLKVLDIAAGHGLFGITLARHNPRAEVYALDWESVLRIAGENAAAAGVAGRFHKMPGSAFELEFGGGFDLVLLTNFFHHFDRETCVALMRKVREALKEGGRAVTLEFVPDEGRVSPRAAASFALVMLGTTPSGDAYTFSEFDAMFREAGFARSEAHPAPPQTIIVSHKQ
jgi:ubiquinone/menaquinone biosynthesis C-methylase UbiE